MASFRNGRLVITGKNDTLILAEYREAVQAAEAAYKAAEGADKPRALKAWQRAKRALDTCGIK